MQIILLGILGIIGNMLGAGEEIIMDRRYTGSRLVNSLKPRQNGRLFADDTFKRIFFNENIWISIKISPKFVPNGPINIIPALVQIMAWRRPGDKSLSEPMMASLLTHICVTWPQWVNGLTWKIQEIQLTFL